MGDIGDGDQEVPAAGVLGVVVGLGEDGVVEVARVGAVDGDQRDIAQVLAAAERCRGGSLGLVDGLLREFAEQAVLVQRDEAGRAGGMGRASCRQGVCQYV